jgi:hypothetical protein
MEKREHCWWECKLAQPLWETVWRALRKVRTELPHNPAIPLLGIYPKDVRSVEKTSTLPCLLLHYSQ